MSKGGSWKGKHQSRTCVNLPIQLFVLPVRIKR
jgi:hypothetical protein